MTKKHLFFLLLTIFSATACNKQQSKLQEIKKLENELLADISKMDKAKAAVLVKKSQEYALAYPDDSTSARVLFRAADVARGIGDFPNAMKMWNEIQYNYASSKYAAESLFLQGFTYENDLQNKDKAKECYLKFLNLYPNHDLNHDITMALKNIDIPIEELIKQFEANNKKEIEGQAK
ncbi:MAG: tetratricopeptide repeat protein [Saprospiraceae bacterium]